MGNFCGLYGSMQQLWNIHHRSIFPGSFRSRLHAFIYRFDGQMVSPNRAAFPRFAVVLGKWHRDYDRCFFGLRPWTYPVSCVEAMANVRHPDLES